jgi:transposase
LAPDHECDASRDQSVATSVGVEVFPINVRDAAEIERALAAFAASASGGWSRLMPPAYVKPYVKRQKNDATDAEATCEAVTRANMRFRKVRTLPMRVVRSE